MFGNTLDYFLTGLHKDDYMQVKVANVCVCFAYE